MRKINDDFTKTEISELAKGITKRRQLLNLSQLKLSKLAGLSSSIINKFENSKIDPSYSTILKIEKALSQKETITNLTAKDVLIKDITSITSTTIISNALNIMRENDFSQLLIIDNNKIIGVIYEKSILDAITQQIDIYKTDVTKILDISPIIVPQNYPISDLSFIFANKRTKFVLVAENNKIYGIVTHSDLFKN